MWQNYTSAVLGLILLIVSFTGISAVALAWTAGVFGILTLVLGVWGGMADGAAMEQREHEHSHA